MVKEAAVNTKSRKERKSKLDAGDIFGKRTQVRLKMKNAKHYRGGGGGAVKM